MIVSCNRWIVIFLLVPLGLISTCLRADEDIANLRKISLDELGLMQFSDNKNGFAFSVFIMDGSGWTLSDVAHTIREAASIYDKQCDFKISIRSIQQGTVALHLQNFNEVRQAKLLSMLKPERPTVFFIDNTQDRDIAYAYLENTASPSQGTIWITRRARKECRGSLLAHEIGHIALHFPSHQTDPGNLLSYSCTTSNIQNATLNIKLTAEQCRTLHQRYPH